MNCWLIIRICQMLLFWLDAISYGRFCGEKWVVIRLLSRSFFVSFRMSVKGQKDQFIGR